MSQIQHLSKSVLEKSAVAGCFFVAMAGCATTLLQASLSSPPEYVAEHYIQQLANGPACSGGLVERSTQLGDDDKIIFACTPINPYFLKSGGFGADCEVAFELAENGSPMVLSSECNHVSLSNSNITPLWKEYGEDILAYTSQRAVEQMEFEIPRDADDAYLSRRRVLPFAFRPESRR